ncbi:MAG: hypothetical protein LC687_05000 [Actinobacteria bacterium]|nr:hypothetical protein [Actinomycetota bacterium]
MQPAAESTEEPEPEGGEDEDELDSMTADQLKERVRELKDEGIEVDTKGVTKKSNLAAAIRAAQA